MPPPLTHITLNTGHVAIRDRSESTDEAIDAIGTVLDAGPRGATIGFAPSYRVTATRDNGGNVYTFDFAQHGRPITVGTICLDRESRESSWWLTLDTYRNLYGEDPPARKPDHRPWIATIIMAAPSPMTDIAMLADAAQCLAWACWEAPPPEARRVISLLPRDIAEPGGIPWPTGYSWGDCAPAQKLLLTELCGRSDLRKQLAAARAARTSTLAHWARWAFARCGALEEFAEGRLARRNRLGD